MTEAFSGATLFTGIRELVTNDLALERGPLGVVEDAALLVIDGAVAWAGEQAHAPAGADRVVDLDDRTVLPGFVDSHNHLAFAGDRSAEFAARMAGRPYRAGGIRTTVEATRASDDETLRRRVRRLRDEALRSGVTTIESKSGYGLTVADEERALRVLGDEVDEVTYLGAHVVPPEYRDRPDDYVHLVTGAMLDACAPHAGWIDVFCDRGAFDVDQSRAILTAGRDRGLGVRIHAGQLEHGGGIRLAVELGAASADHVTHASAADVDALASSDTVATLLPGAEFSTRAVYPDGRRLIDAGVTVALACDCNPGSSYTTSMPFCIAVAVRDMRLTPDEAIWAASAGGAASLRRDDVGHLRPGAGADLVVLDAPSRVHLAYRPGVDLVDEVWRAGAPAYRRGGR